MSTITEETTSASVAWATKRLWWERRLEELRAECNPAYVMALSTQPAPSPVRQRRVRPRPATNEV